MLIENRNEITATLFFYFCTHIIYHSYRQSLRVINVSNIRDWANLHLGEVNDENTNTNVIIKSIVFDKIELSTGSRIFSWEYFVQYSSNVINTGSGNYFLSRYFLRLFERKIRGLDLREWMLRMNKNLSKIRCNRKYVDFQANFWLFPGPIEDLFLSIFKQKFFNVWTREEHRNL